MTNKEFCKRLRKAKIIAISNYPDLACISAACREVGIRWDGMRGNANAEIIGVKRMWQWVLFNCKSPDDISAVFDASISALGGEP